MRSMSCCVSDMRPVCSGLHTRSSIFLHCGNHGYLRYVPNMDIRDRIKDAIARSDGLTVRNASLRAGLSDSALHKFLTRQTKSITIDSLEKLASALGVSMRWLMFGDPEIENVHIIWEHIPDRRKKAAVAALRAPADMDGDDNSSDAA